MAATVNTDTDEKVTNNNTENSFVETNGKSISPLIDCNDNSNEVLSTWGFNLDELYTLATTFFKEKGGKAFQLSYSEKNSLIALVQQVVHGPFQQSKSPPLGYLDVIGRDRRQAWQILGTLSKQESKEKFVSLLDSVCPLFRPFVQAHKCHLLEQERQRKEEEERKRLEAEEEEQARLEEEQIRLEEEKLRKEEKEKQKQLHQKRLIQEALNRQTFHQFKLYSEKQFPGDPEQQAVLIRQLQEQHYQQYMQQVLQDQLSPSTDGNDKPTENSGRPESSSDGEDGETCVDSGFYSIDSQAVGAAQMWTRNTLDEFKTAIRREGGDGIIKVGHGETVTVRVPTHYEGRCLFWEFGTDSYDIGFGLFFEWTSSPDSQVTVHISESEDDEEDDEELENISPAGDVEKGSINTEHNPVSVLIPVYRRDSHLEVYIGCHEYPGKGVHLLKFDNSYSLWRAKTLYYRVYYTQ